MAETNPLLPAYLANGEDELKRETVLGRLRARMSEFGDLDFNSDVFDGETAVGGDIVAACNTVPFASEARLVVVHNADLLKKQDAEALVDYLREPSPTAVLCLVSRKLAKNTRLYKAVVALGKQAVIDCAPRKSYELSKTVRALAVSYGITLSDAGARHLVELVGENTVRLDAEIRKLALAHTGAHSIGPSEVEALVTRSAEAKPWDFTAAFAARDVSRCISLLSRMDSISPYALIGMCVARLRELIIAQALANRGQTTTKALAIQLKLPDWRVKNHLTWARCWRAEELRGALISARDAECAMKSGSDADAAFLEWTLSVLRTS